MEGISIEVKNLSLNISNNQILENISLNFEKGKIHAIIGPNGGGKTSFLKCLLGQMPYKGEILFKYEDKDKIGYVPQTLDFEKTLPITITDFLSMCYSKKPAFLSPNLKKKELFNEILEEVGLKHKEKRLLGNLSGGELKRLLLAQAINPRPNLLILDEPFAGVDTVGEQYFLNTIKNLRDEGITIIWIHHNIKVAREYADTITCIKKDLKFQVNKDEEISNERLLDIYS
ncbi:metal ABC transporter ATP-binding protein [Oceanivirga miroungae]|uniref:metal ABC transporter ATP-binding protein n=1 Tax=Oceanivirga miroungae TaxID=1130046 RepID=UPI0018D1477C|nr:metal ABC transporter ATP-binding protein [Oceanivirga miroungae]